MGGRPVAPPPPPPPPPPPVQRAIPAARPAAAGIASGLPQAVEAEVKRALELATAKEFEEAERCLNGIAITHAEHKDAREVSAAWEAVAMCKQFHARRA